MPEEVGTAVMHLLELISPPDVARLIVAIVVDPVKAHALRPRAQILLDVADERPGIVPPLVADPDTPSPVPTVVMGSRIVTAPIDSQPETVQRRSRLTVRSPGLPDSQVLTLPAAATLGPSAAQGENKHVLRSTTGTPAGNGAVAGGLHKRLPGHRPASELLTYCRGWSSHPSSLATVIRYTHRMPTRERFHPPRTACRTPLSARPPSNRGPVPACR
jgi:hypothetical protein